MSKPFLNDSLLQEANDVKESESSLQATPSQSIYVPELPQKARLPPSVDTRHPWLDLYVVWAGVKSPLTPTFFNEAAGLWLASVGVARRLVVPMAHGDIHPNLYFAWIAPSTAYAKTTSMDLARELAEEVFPHLLAPQDTTPEALLHEMAGLEPTGLRDLPKADQDLWEAGRLFAGQKGWVLDEFSTLLATARRDYGAGLIEAMLRFYNCDPLFRRLTRGGGLAVVRDSYLSFFGASTPAALRKHLQAEPLWSRGWWPRFALLFPEGIPPWRVSVDVPRPPRLAQGLRRLYEALPPPSGSQTLETLRVKLGPGVSDAWQAYDKAMRHDLLTDELGRLAAYYGRLPTKAVKIATLLAALDWGAETQREEAPTIELRHWYRGQKITEAWRASGHRLLAAITKSELDATMERVVGIVSKAGREGITLRDIGRRMQDKRRNDVKRAVESLTAIGEFDPFPYKPPRGRPTTRFRIA